MMLSCKDPGYIKNEGIEFMNLLETFEPHQLCPDCEIIRTNRSRHCILCRKCVDRYDHHCPWINNCIGILNHNLFLAYLIFQQFSLLLTFITSVIVCTRFKPQPINQNVGNTEDYQHHLFWVAQAMLFAVSILFMLPLFKLI